MKAKNRIILILIINLFIVVVETILVTKGLSSGHTIKQVDDTTRSAGYFSAFTVDCECIMAIISLVGVILCIKALVKQEDILPEWFDTLYLMGTASLTLVFIVVAGYLAPIKAANGYGYFFLFKKGNFFNHFLNPWLSIICFDVINNMREVPRKSAWFAPIPMGLYALAYLTNVVLIGKWPDLYSFFPGDRYWLFPIELVIIFAITYGLGRLHIKLHNKK